MAKKKAKRAGTRSGKARKGKAVSRVAPRKKKAAKKTVKKRSSGMGTARGCAPAFARQALESRVVAMAFPVSWKPLVKS